MPVALDPTESTLGTPTKNGERALWSACLLRHIIDAIRIPQGQSSFQAAVIITADARRGLLDFARDPHRKSGFNEIVHLAGFDPDAIAQAILRLASTHWCQDPLPGYPDHRSVTPTERDVEMRRFLNVDGSWTHGPFPIAVTNPEQANAWLDVLGAPRTATATQIRDAVLKLRRRANPAPDHAPTSTKQARPRAQPPTLVNDRPNKPMPPARTFGRPLTAA